MPVFIGGAELNVATALSKWNVPVQYFTALPDSYLSREIIDVVSKRGIDLSKIIFSGDRIGVYYLPQGADLKNAGVIYDRAHSSFASLQPGMLNWDQLLEGISCFHFSAISPAVSAGAAAVCLEGVQAAAAKGITVSLDLNYRAKLWKYGTGPLDLMCQLLPYCNIVMGNIWSANSLLGIPVDPALDKDATKEMYIAHARFSSLQIMEAFPSVSVVANTFRFDEGKGIRYFGTMDLPEQQVISNEYVTASVVDKIGSGDCFMAGLLYGLFEGQTFEQIINFSAAAAFGKLQEKSDATNQEISSINKIVELYGAGKNH